MVKSTIKKDFKDTVESKQITMQEPTDEEIRELAEILYQMRIENGETGSEVDDWFRARDYLRNK